MAEIVIELSEDLKRKMSEIKIDWSLIVAAFLRDKLIEWSRLRSIADESKLTEKDASDLGNKINRGLAKRYKELASSK